MNVRAFVRTRAVLTAVLVLPAAASSAPLTTTATLALLAAASVAIAPAAAGAQVVSPPDTGRAQLSPDALPPQSGTGFFVSLGGGVGTRDIGGQASLTLTVGPHHVIARSAGTAEFAIFSPPRSAEDVAVLYGRRSQGRRGWARLAAGPGVITVTDPGRAYDCAWFICSYERSRKTSLGLAIQADAVWAPSRAFGLGLSAAGNVSPAGSFAVLALGVHLGKVR